MPADPLDTAVERQELTHELRLAAETGIDGDGIFRWKRPLPELLLAAVAALDAQSPTRTEGEERCVQGSDSRGEHCACWHGVASAACCWCGSNEDTSDPCRPAPPVPEPGDEPCGNRGPRIGSEGTTCWRPKGHDSHHQAHDSWTDNRGLIPTWSETASSDAAPCDDLLNRSAPAPVPEERRGPGAVQALRSGLIGAGFATNAADADQRIGDLIDRLRAMGWSLSPALSSPPATPGGGEAEEIDQRVWVVLNHQRVSIHGVYTDFAEAQTGAEDVRALYPEHPVPALLTSITVALVPPRSAAPGEQYEAVEGAVWFEDADGGVCWGQGDPDDERHRNRPHGVLFRRLPAPETSEGSAT